jgi:hypothetical protein
MKDNHECAVGKDMEEENYSSSAGNIHLSIFLDRLKNPLKCSIRTV